MKKDEFISIKEFSERANVSVQSIYKRLNGLNNPLNQFVKLVDNQRMLNIRALEEIYGIEVEQPIQPLDSTYSTFDSTQDDTIKLLQKTIDLLEKELEIKNSQIEELQKSNNELSNKLIDVSGRVSDTLHTMSQSQLAEKMIEGKKLIDEPKKKWWNFWN